MTVTPPLPAAGTGRAAGDVVSRHVVALPRGLHAPRMARRAVARWAARCPLACTADVTLIVSELVTNVVRHTDCSCVLTLTLYEKQMDIAVADHSEELPQTDSLPGEQGGFGLALVGGLGGRVTVVPALGGKTVHVTLDTTPPAHPRHAPLVPRCGAGAPDSRGDAGLRSHGL
ncbi:ATP-binding protein [Streptomyces sp. NPDC101225]|uniref:ATP-binding protein n=1 Tax=Streptomyces sp. NPDC101225 TaxID=3366135 RepID=UPI00382249D7